MLRETIERLRGLRARATQGPLAMVENPSYFGVYTDTRRKLGKPRLVATFAKPHDNARHNAELLAEVSNHLDALLDVAEGKAPVTVEPPKAALPRLEWRETGSALRRELFLGGIYVGEVHRQPKNARIHPDEWRAWVMDMEDGSDHGWYGHELEAKGAVERAVRRGLGLPEE